MTSDPVFTRFDTATFALSVADLGDLRSAPLAAVPEVAFVGRSNAGKSTSINVLVNRTRLAYASKTPGRTQMLNFFALSEGKDTDTCGYLVDLPGYGFAKVDAQTRQRWNDLVGGYLTERPQLRGVVLVMDSRRPLLAADEDLIGLLCQRVHVAPVALHLLLSKADQIRTMERRAVLQKAAERALSLPLSTSVQLFSAKAREGIDALREQVGRMLAAPSDEATA
jgi:GTP-binding protein